METVETRSYGKKKLMEKFLELLDWPSYYGATYNIFIITGKNKLGYREDSDLNEQISLLW
jgi:hypothetical protein